MSDVRVIGTGMHPWGKWGRNFVDYGMAAAHAALEDSGVPWKDIGMVVGAETIRCGYPGFIAGSTFAHELGWTGVPALSCYAACASGSAAISVARAHILAGLCDTALVIGADTTPKGFLAPVAGDRPDDPDWQRFRLLGATNPVYFALYARRRMELYGASSTDFAEVRAKNSRHGTHNDNARYRDVLTADDVLASPMVSDPLHLLEICATSDGAAALVLCSDDYARRHGLKDAVRLRSVAIVTPDFPETGIDMPNFATDSGGQARDNEFKHSIARQALEAAHIGPSDLSLAEVYDLSSAMELDWYEAIGLCEVGGAERLLRSGATEIGGRVPVNPSGGLASFGEAVPAQAIAQVCEVTQQLRGRSGGRQVSGARVGLTANQGLFGHGSACVLSI